MALGSAIPAPGARLEERLFLVGCSRSGTTLLQVLLSNHPDIHSFPETSFFINAIGVCRRPLAKLGLATGKERQAMLRFLKRVGREELSALVPRRPLLLRTAVLSFVAILDRLALEEGKQVWVEKSPMHIHYVGFIRKFVPNARFIHMLRDGREVVASLYDRALRYPERFGRQSTADFAIRRWNRAVEISRRWTGKPGHVVVFYEELVREPDRVLRRVCGELEIPYDAKMATKGAVQTGVVMPHQKWMLGALNPPQRVEPKFQRLFGEEERERITRALNSHLLEEIRTEVGAL